MNADAIRRYLQPSPTLRWHPWAPLVVGVLVVLFAFLLGAGWGWNASQRQWRSLGHVYGGRVYTDYLGEERWPGHRLVSDAGSIDATVRQFVRQQQHVPGWWERERAKLEKFTFNAWTGTASKEGTVAMAEFRLRELSPSHPRWQATSGWCERYGRRFQEVDVLAAYEDVAKDYSTLLGRKVGPRELAPLVPQWKCPAELPRTTP